MKHRGMTLLELMLALAITAVISMAIAFMLGAVSTGVETRRDARSVVVMTNAAAARIASYIVPSRCALECTNSQLVLWFEDSRESGTVHATELRWFRFDVNAGTFNVYFVRLPEEWTQVARELEDLEYASTSDWNVVFEHYASHGWMGSRTLVDSLESIIMYGGASSEDSRSFSFELNFEFDGHVIPMLVACHISQHYPPTS